MKLPKAGDVVADHDAGNSADQDLATHDEAATDRGMDCRADVPSRRRAELLAFLLGVTPCAPWQPC
jgi:hypothetical protein